MIDDAALPGGKLVCNGFIKKLGTEAPKRAVVTEKVEEIGDAPILKLDTDGMIELGKLPTELQNRSMVAICDIGGNGTHALVRIPNNVPADRPPPPKAWPGATPSGLLPAW